MCLRVQTSSPLIFLAAVQKKILAATLGYTWMHMLDRFSQSVLYLWHKANLRNRAESSATHLASKHERNGAIRTGHFAVAQHGRETVQLLDAGWHFLTAMAAEPLGQRRARNSPPRAILAPASPATSCSTTSPRTSSSSCPSTAAAAARSHHPPSFLVSLHHAREGTASLLPSSSEFSTRPPLRHHCFSLSSSASLACNEESVSPPSYRSSTVLPSPFGQRPHGCQSQSRCLHRGLAGAMPCARECVHAWSTAFGSSG